MNTYRLESFSDGVIAVILTITVLGVHVPDSASLAGLIGILPILLIYAWSFQVIGTYWNNHHHLLKATKEASAVIMWTNLLFLFWLSLIPFATQWLGEHIGEVWPTAAYCAVLLAVAIAFTLLEYAVAAQSPADSPLRYALSHDTKGWLTLAGHMFAVLFSFIDPWIAYGLIITIALVWFIPDRRGLPNKPKLTQQ